MQPELGDVVGTPIACYFERTGDIDAATPAKVTAVSAGGVYGLIAGFAIVLRFIAIYFAD